MTRQRTPAPGEPSATALPVDAWFPLFPRDWLTGQGTFTMTAEQRGMFINLLCHAWLQEPACTLPDDEAALAKYADVTVERWREVGGAVRGQFIPRGEGRIANPRQMAVYVDAVARRTAIADRNRLAAERRWGRNGDGAPADANGMHAHSARTAGAMPEECPTPSPSSSPSSPYSDDNNGNNNAAAGGVAARGPAGPTAGSSAGAAADPVVFAEVIAPFPAIVAFVAATPEHEQTFRRYLNYVYQRHGARALTGFAAEAGGSLQGIHGPALTHEQLRTALEDWCDTDTTGSKVGLRAYLETAAAGKKASEKGQRRASSTPNRRRADQAAGKLTSEW